MARGREAHEKKHYIEAARWFRDAAHRGDATAQVYLGLSFELGQGVDESMSEAAKWYGRAAEQGNAIAQRNLGTLFFRGQGIATKDYTVAYKWFELAAAQGDEIAKNHRHLIAKFMKPIEIAEAKSRAKAWKPKRKQPEQTALIAPIPKIELGTASPRKPAVGVFPQRNKPGDVFKDCPDCPEMVVIPAGSFIMGSPASEPKRDKDEGPQHRVIIRRSRSICYCRHPV